MKKVFTVLFSLMMVVQLQAQTAWDIIQGSPEHTTLEAAVLAAGLDGAIATSPGITVFAPTDAAFAALPAGLVDALLADPSGQLTDILLYHVVGAVAFSGDLSDGQMFTTLQGQDVTISIGGTVMVNDATVTGPDNTATNGVVHIIDGVLVPPAIVTSSIADIVAASEVHNTLEVALNAAGLTGVLSDAGSYTLFAPTDAAFAALPAGLLDNLLADPSGALTDVLLYHVLGSAVMSGDLSDGMMATTLQGQDITITITGGMVFINDAMVTVADIPATNGVVHVIDAVLVPQLPTNTIYDIVSNSDVHNTLQAAIDAAGLAETLSGGSYTLFAPTDDAFAALPAGLLDALLADPSGDLTQILFYHVLNGVALSTDLSDGMMVATLQGQDITVTISGGNVMINDAMVVVADLIADNGVVHVIDAVLVPPTATPTTVFDIIANSDVHNTLEAALIAAELNVDLSTAGPFTVFAPTDAAFNALPAGLVDALLADPAGELTNILLYHVVSGTVLSTDLQEGFVVTLNGAEVEITFNGSDVFVNDAMVVIADLVADNGVVHVIDAVLVPVVVPATVADIIIDSPDHTVLEQALIAANLVDDLQGEGPFTVFAPTDGAFSALPANVLTALLANPSELAAVLLYHVVGDNLTSADLSNGQILPTLFSPNNIQISITGGNVFVNGTSQVIVADLLAQNGVVHVIDEVLLVPSQINELEILSLELFPNPAEEVLNINVANATSRVNYEVVDLSGARIMQGSLNGTFNSLDIQNLAAGMYAIRVIDGENIAISTFLKK